MCFYSEKFEQLIMKRPQRFCPLRFFYIWLRYGFCHSVIFFVRYFNRCMLTCISVSGYSKSPSLALGTYFAPRMSLYQELPYGVSRCLLLDISPFSTLFMHRKAHTTTIYTNIHKTERKGDKTAYNSISDFLKAHQLRITE